MKPEQWYRIERIYSEVLEIEPAGREAFLNQACAEDASLRKEIDALLEAREEAGGFIESPAVEVAARALIGKEGGLSGQDPASKPGGETVGDHEAAGKKDRAPDPVKETAKPTHPKRAPWWMYALIAAFLLCTAIRYYDFSTAPEDPGLMWEPGLIRGTTEKKVRVTEVKPGLAGAKAGIEVGDWIEVTGSEYLDRSRPGTGYGYLKADYPYPLKITRDRETKIIYLELDRTFSPVKWLIDGGVRSLVLLNSLSFLILALIVALARPYDLAARWGALMMGTISIYCNYSMGSPSWGSTLLALPRPVAWLTVLFPALASAIQMSAIITFFAVFPRRLFRQNWIWALVWLPALIFIPPGILSNHEPVYSVNFQWPQWYLTTVSLVALASIISEFVVTILNYRRLRDPNDRRRVRILIIGAAASMVGLSPVISMSVFPGLFRLLFVGTGVKNTIVMVLNYIAFISPIIKAYGIMRHRLFDIRIMIRQGVQYAAARGFILSLVPIILLVMAVDLAVHRSQTLEKIMAQRGLLYAVMVGAALLLYFYRRTWLEALDRRFFREHYEAHGVLRTVIEEIRKSGSFEKVAPGAVLQIESALHPQTAAILVRRPGESAFKDLAREDRELQPIAADSRLLAMIRVLDKPVEISHDPDGWPWTQLPEEESRILRQSNLEWLFPICLTEGRTEALLAVGPKRSESPYSREDQELLQGIAGSLALLLEQSPVVDIDSWGFKECPECGMCYDSDSDSCRNGGTTLTPIPYPRVLGCRYRFEQRLGKGGMGIVYRSFDMELERHVAVKLIHPALTDSSEAATRFKREARVAAGFTHPNVVTVYDFDVGEGQRAYLVMELLHGSTLRQELRQCHHLSASRTSEILSGVCAAVDAAHRQRLLHRDLKPENIFVASSEGMESVKILDFGVAKSLIQSPEDLDANQTEPGRLVGTLKYMSPEELHGDKPDEGWDIWALAVIAYEMLVGLHPFAGATSAEVRNAILDGRMTPLSEHLPEAPAGWQYFFEKTLAPDRGLRPQSAYQLLSDFKDCIA
ncbi:MAG: protein kinase [Acidobacteria bacterium]|nr:protein kinase [Acidobacteriota bacterium]